MVGEFPVVEGGVPINPDVFTRLNVGNNIGFGVIRIEEGSDVELNFALGLNVTVGVDVF